jgi:hypothetical protein
LDTNDPRGYRESSTHPENAATMRTIGEGTMSTPTSDLGHLLERNLFEVFGEPDSGRRTRAIAELYAEDCAFYDAEGEGTGQAAVSEQVARILDALPAGFAFSLVSPAEILHDLGRLRWRSGPPGAPPVVSGMDIAVFANGKIRTLYTFVEAADTSSA